MKQPPVQAPLSHKIRYALAAVVIIVLGVVVLRACLVSPSLPLIHQRQPAEWIMYPMPVESQAVYFRPDQVPYTEFSTTFTPETTGENPRIEIRAYGEISLDINGLGVGLDTGDSRNWKRPISVDLSEYLRPGVNTLRAVVSNSRGPGLLSVTSHGLEHPIHTDRSWMASANSGKFRHAVPADDTRAYLDTCKAPTPLGALHQKMLPILLLFIAALSVSLASPLIAGRLRPDRRPLMVPLGLTAIWIFIFGHSILSIPSTYGFDAGHHADYVGRILEYRALPNALDDIETYQPPLFYVLCALVYSIARLLLGQDIAAQCVRVVPFIGGLGGIWLTFGVSRMLFRDSARTMLATLIAGMIPMGIYMSAYFSNESFAGLMCGLAIFLAVRVLQENEIGPRSVVLLTLVLGLALLTKLTAAIIAVLAIAAVACKLILVDRADLRRTTLTIGTMLGGIALITGWYYVRQIVAYGRPIFGVWDEMLEGLYWWQQPGFRTLAYYARFGECLRHPFYSGFVSFWDGLYSTFWGDGLVGGRMGFAQRCYEWNYDYMAATYLLALPSIPVMITGLVSAIREMLGNRAPSFRLIAAFGLAVVASVSCSMLYLTVRFPFSCNTKAFYGLSLLMPLSVLMAIGVHAIARTLSSPRMLLARSALYAWLITLAGVIFLSFCG